MTSEPFRLTDALNKGITAQMNAQGKAAGLRPLRWSIDSGRVVTGHPDPGYAQQEVTALLDAWATWLGLTACPPVCAGTVEYSGQVERWPVAVWGVIDRDAFEGEYAARRRASEAGTGTGESDAR